MRFLLIFLFITNGLVYGQSRVSDKFIFPFKSESSEWNSFNSVEERIKALQIPEKALKNISTEGLIETCIEFPYLTDMFFYENAQRGFEELTKEFNGLQELLKRKDLMDKLLVKYIGFSSSILDTKGKKPETIGRESFQQYFIEMIFAQDMVIKSLTTEQEKQLIFQIIEQNKTKTKNPEIFSNLNFIPTNLLFAKKIVSDSNFKLSDPNQKMLQDFVKNPSVNDQQIFAEIENYFITKYKY